MQHAQPEPEPEPEPEPKPLMVRLLLLGSDCVGKSPPWATVPLAIEAITLCVCAIRTLQSTRGVYRVPPALSLREERD